MDKQAEAALNRAIGMLEAILQRQIGLHSRMLEVAEAKRESIIKGDIEALEKTVAEEKKLVAEIEEEERKRFAVMPMVKRGLSLPEGDDKLSDLIEKIPEPMRGNLAAIRVKLKGVIEECRRKTRHNAELLKASLAHVESFLKSVAEAANPDTNYKKDGKKNHGGPTMLDRNA